MPKIVLHKGHWLSALLVLVSVVLDQYTKAIASGALSYGQPVYVLSFLDWTLLHNPGAAFSFLSDQGGWQRWFFTAVAALVSVVLVVWIARLTKDKLWESSALALVLGGAVGNLIDRVQLGYVVDFISMHYEQYYWPAFNIADSVICIGVAMLIVDMFRSKPNEPQEKNHE
ncbi:signal peptidase II [Simiduia aestuariiviva]|uniref:Lipoprotein signal peptidase n=1 Tax=Simiduia aestuariiviva TaxID=1510459 RepID=A0A839UXE2_9GAMM|nr:signal peptidase II [Simiduia aestuariiviva]MBB3170118.1 signal peptidase II [Simiduia aestuariiviva]